MGSKNSKEKEKDTEFTGPMGIMHDKYGSAATHQCHEWIKLGFPEKGTFSLNQIEILKALLRAHKNNKRRWRPNWMALALWQKETLSRQVKQARGGINIFPDLPVNSVYTSGATGQYPMLDCPNPQAGQDGQPPLVRVY